ncbi:MAG TPA: FAD-dependent tricarballylate dehydrogenase TcuA [Nocardioides sp.]|uniref:FAD-dependent tricarballylate dehydrogenase TcuA n=1 Tax=uncultured Nocardioides sp. TaxID=198441 RepID=UPI0026233B65|nr:FAD-dependent tricarballylate dehydrogenase TcuA [uncultured Nocardioides sp.]HRD59460.1 FAD-dependent tricarballylate dehydrogenase TcuA [Nocardioides sp.]HRI95837.1 FAD-dependent tricarballylate dehydrogenase TcuA [Nocardioides sp.]HRK46479.1 FAD-dependent tricarballylate dehydrogenase TcuA [Nocardioides sp.]
MRYDVVVVGGGNAGMSAALAAAERASKVLVLERAPHEERGGNTGFTAGAMRFAYDGVDDLTDIVSDLDEATLARTDFGSYPESQFYDDLDRVTESRCDPDLAEVLVTGSQPAVRWLKSKGVRFLPIYGRQAYEVDNKFTFWGGLTLEVSGGGRGMVEYLERACASNGITVEYATRARELVVSSQGVVGLKVERQSPDGHLELATIECSSVVLAAGGFQSNAAWRVGYLGPGWDLAKVRGTRYDTGDGIEMGLAVGASPAGHWSGCHAVAWDYNAPEYGVLEIGDSFQKHSYPLGIVVNRDGKRFVDEGADFRNYTYAKYGREILAQPGQLAWQVFDAKVLDRLRDEYRIRQVSKVRANSLPELAVKMGGIDEAAFLKTVAEYNGAVRSEDADYNPNILDGLGTVGLPVNKSNWALTIDEPPFEAYAVTCGITFTFGGLRIDNQARVLNDAGAPIPGLFAAGEMVGGLFYFNYPGGSGLSNGTVLGRLAGSTAGDRAAGTG